MNYRKQKLFNAAAQACDDLRAHIVGSVELNEADKQASIELVKVACTDSLYFFAKEVLGFNLLTSQTHRRWADDIQKKIITHKKIMRIKPRGTYKTTLYGEAVLLWIWAVISPEVRIGYFSANASLLDEVSAHLDHYIDFDTDSLYSLVFNIRRDKKAKKNTNAVFNITGRDASTKGTSLMFRTAGGSTNGLHPNYIIIDDPMDKDDRESAAVRLKKERWYDSLHPLLVPIFVTYKGKPLELRHLQMITTRWHLADLVAYIKAKDKSYDIEEEGVYLDTADTDGKRLLTYPEMHTHEGLEEIAQGISEVFFACQYLNNPLPDGLRLFPIEKLKVVDVLDEATFSYEQGTNYCFLDPAKGTEKGAYPALIFVNRYNGRNVFFDAIDKKMALDEIIALAARKCKIYGVKIFVYESNGTTLLKSAIDRCIKEQEYHCRVKEITESRNKAERIASMQPDLIYGENYFRLDHQLHYKELMNQLTLYPAYGPVDFPDVIEKAVSYVSKFASSGFSDGGAGSKGISASGGTFAGSLNKSKTGW